MKLTKGQIYKINQLANRMFNRAEKFWARALQEYMQAKFGKPYPLRDDVVDYAIVLADADDCEMVNFKKVLNEVKDYRNAFYDNPADKAYSLAVLERAFIKDQIGKAEIVSSPDSGSEDAYKALFARAKAIGSMVPFHEANC